MDTNPSVANQTVRGKERYKSGVLEYRKMGYWEPDYTPKDSDSIAMFRITPQDGVDPVPNTPGQFFAYMAYAGG